MGRESRWEVRAVNTVYTDRWITLKHEHVRLPNGQEIRAYNIIEQGDFCEIIALTPDLCVPLVRQYKHGARRSVLEFPAGLVDTGEDPAETARRELLEETGYHAHELVCTGHLLTNPSRNRNWAHFFVARDAVQVADPRPEVTEDITVELLGLAEVTRQISSGGICSVGSVAGYALARRAFPDLPWEHPRSAADGAE